MKRKVLPNADTRRCKHAVRREKKGAIEEFLLLFLGWYIVVLIVASILIQLIWPGWKL